MHAFDFVNSILVSIFVHDSKNLLKMQFFSTFFILLNILTLLIGKSNAGVSTAAVSRGRSNSMTSITRQSEFKPLTRAQAEEFSSDVALNEAESRASTLRRQHESDIHEHQHLLEERRSVSFATPVDLSEASRVTNQGENLDHARDGVFARVQRVLSGVVAPVAAGAAVGVGILELINSTRVHSTPMKTRLADLIVNRNNDVINNFSD